MAPTNGRVADGIHGGGPEYSDHLYNQATYIGASCLLYKLTGQTKYRTNALNGTSYVFNSMVQGTNKILNFENGYEQGVYAAIFAQYLPMVVYDLGQKTYLTYIQRNMQKAWDNRDQSRGLQAGNFNKKTSETDVVESYGGSGMPALMLMFPAHITAEDIEAAVDDIPDDQASLNSDVYTIDGKLVMKDATFGQVESLDKGLYIYQQKKLLVRK